MIRRDFEIYRYRYMDEVELHHHDFYEIYMLLRGSVSYTCLLYTSPSPRDRG